MKKYILLIAFFGIVFLWSPKISAQNVNFVWEKYVINMPINSSITDYEDSYVVKLYIDGKASTEYFYVEKNIDYTTLSTVITSRPGIYNVIYKAVCPKYNLESKQKITFIVYDNIPPFIMTTKDEITIEFGASIDFMNYIYAYDNYDQKLTYEVDTSKVVYQQLGRYPVKISTFDSAGNSSYVIMYLNITDSKEPEISILKDFTIYYGESFKIEEYFMGYDNYDGNITSNIKISGLNTLQLGEQTIILELADSSGNRTNKTLKMFIIDLVLPEIVLKNNEIFLNIKESYDHDFFLNLVYSVYDNHSYLTKDDIDINYTNYKIKIGYQYLLYSISDESENLFEIKLKIYFYEDNPPELIITDLKLALYSSFNPFDYIEIISEYDDNPKEHIEIVYNDINTNINGKYTLICRAYNLSGKFVTKRINVYVGDIEDEEIKTAIPSDDNMYLYYSLALIGTLGVIVLSCFFIKKRLWR